MNLIESLSVTLDLIKMQIDINAAHIKQYQKDVKSILNAAPKAQKTLELNELFETNNSLLKENGELMKIQRQLEHFLKTFNYDIHELKKEGKSESKQSTTHDGAEPSKTNESPDFDAYLKKTVENEIEFDSSHPFYKDASFVEKLMLTYIEHEQYEKCIDLQKLENK